MSGISRTFFTVLAAFLRLVAWVPLGIGEVVMMGAEWCEERAVAPAPERAP